MRNRSSYKQISRLYRRFQFHVSSFILGIAGIWLFWKISRESFIPDWLMYLVLLWVVILVAELDPVYLHIKKSSRK